MTVPEANAALRWHDEGWLAEAAAWIDDRVDRAGELEQVHVYPWATAIRVPTRDGRVWFKACIDELAHEITTLELLAARRADLVTVVLAGDRGRGWMLLADAGTRLRDLHEQRGQAERWERAAARYAELQLAAAADADRLVAGGAPEIARVRGLASRVAADVEELAALGLPPSVQHDDFHDGNVFVRGEDVRVIDWGDACVTHPLLSLHVMLRALTNRFGRGAPEPARVREAYLEPFTAPCSRAELVAALPAVARVGLAGGAVKWWEIVRALPPETRGPYLGVVPYNLRELVQRCD